MQDLTDKHQLQKNVQVQQHCLVFVNFKIYMSLILGRDQNFCVEFCFYFQLYTLLVIFYNFCHSIVRLLYEDHIFNKSIGSFESFFSDSWFEISDPVNKRI